MNCRQAEDDVELLKEQMIDAVDSFRVVISASDSQWLEWQHDKRIDDHREHAERASLLLDAETEAEEGGGGVVL